MQLGMIGLGGMGSNMVQRLMKEGWWTVKAAVDDGVPAPVISAMLSCRFASRHNEEYATKLLSAMRCEFGGHEENAADKAEAA